MSNTSVGSADAAEDNNDQGNDGLGNKTFGERSTTALPDGPGGPDSPDPAGAPAKPAADALPVPDGPNGPNVGPSPWEKEAAEGKLPEV